MADKPKNKSSVEDLVADVEAYLEDWFQAKLPFTFQGGVRWSPPTDVYETPDEIVVAISIPGMRTKDIEVRFEGDLLRVRGVRRERCDDRHYHKMEIPVGPFERRVRIRRAIRVDDIRVRYESGLLHVALPKVPAGAKDVPIS